MTAAVTPDPQLVTTGFLRSTPALAKISRRLSRLFSSPFSDRVPTGTFRAPGMCPERIPSRGSASRPVKRPAARASAIWERRPSTILLISAKLTTFVSLNEGVKSVAAIFVASSVTGKFAAFQPSKPPSSTRTFFTPMTRNIHHTRGAENMPGPS